MLLTIVFAAWSIYPVLRMQYQQEREKQALAAELSGLKDRNAELREQVDRLKTPEGVEQAARESLGFVKPGEQAYVVTGGSLDASAAPVLGSLAAERPFWRQALDFIFGFE